MQIIMYNIFYLIDKYKNLLVNIFRLAIGTYENLPSLLNFADSQENCRSLYCKNINTDHRNLLIKLIKFTE